MRPSRLSLLSSFFVVVNNLVRAGSNSTQSNSSCASVSGEESHGVGGLGSSVWPWQIYKSAPYNPPQLDIISNGQPLAPGLLVFAPSDFSTTQAVKEQAPVIMTQDGQLVWNGPVVAANNFRVATFEGQKILTYWSGGSTGAANIGHGYGNVTFLDSSYNEILVVCPKLGLVYTDNTPYPCDGDLHESFVTDRNTIIVSAYNVTQTDLSSVRGPVDGWVFDCLFFELEPRTGKILFSWSALEHTSVSDTKLPIGTTGTNQSNPFDWFHINSVVNIGDQYLVNSRHLWTTYLVTSKGAISWTIQGETGGDFGPLPSIGQFSWQHFARPHNVTKNSINIAYFNNHNSQVDNGTHPSNLLELHLSLPPNNSTPPIVLQHQSPSNGSVYADSQGSHLLLHNGNSFGGYGQIPIMREFGPNDPSGNDLRWQARFGSDNLVQSYRVYKHKWNGKPKTAPNLVVDFDVGGCSTGYVSWNGATDVSVWTISEGRVGGPLVQTRKVEFKGFETKFPVSEVCVQVAAVVGGESTKSNLVCGDSITA